MGIGAYGRASGLRSRAPPRYRHIMLCWVLRGSDRNSINEINVDTTVFYADDRGIETIAVVTVKDEECRNINE